MDEVREVARFTGTTLEDARARFAALEVLSAEARRAELEATKASRTHMEARVAFWRHVEALVGEAMVPNRCYRFDAAAGQVLDGGPNQLVVLIDALLGPGPAPAS